MKKILALFILVSSLAFAPGEVVPAKPLTVSAKISEWNKQIQKLEAVKQIFDASNLPFQQVKFSVTTIDSLELFLVPQFQEQLKKDSTKQELTASGILQEWNKQFNKLGAIKQLVTESNLPNQQVKFVSSTIDSLNILLIPQLQKQLPADSTKKK